MAFAYTREGRGVMGNKRVAWGTFTNGAGDSGGDIVTGLTVVENFMITQTGAAVVADDAVVNETLPLTGSTAVTIVTALDADGYWFAIGR